ncbi:MAG: HEAT repeat domain-containing protein, partial [Alphaproteobacteria bacterium]|nr:HEAT repeat domain-containing protein [Alphaproteobacteria bacterium]
MSLRYSIPVLAILSLTACVSQTSRADGAPTKAQIREVFGQLAAFDYGKSPSILSAVDDCINAVRGNKELRSAIERELIRIIESDAKFAAKQAACRRLLIVGSDASVGVLSAMLGSKDHKVVEAACYALSGHATPKTKAALRKALDPAGSDPGQAAIITLLGNMRDSESLGALVRLAGSKHPVVSAAAIFALGRIASGDAVASLRKLLAGGNRAKCHAAAAALLQAAQELASRHKATDAAAIYKELAAAQVPGHIRRGAFIGRSRLEGAEMLADVLAALDGDDRTMKAAAISLIPSVKGKNVTLQAAGKLGRLSARYRRSLIRAIGRRREAEAIPILIKATGDPDTAVQIAAMEFLGRLGDKRALGVLFTRLGDNKKELRETAGGALRIIPAKGIDAAILAKMTSTRGQLCADLIRILVERKYKPVAGASLKIARGGDIVVGRQAVRAVRMLAGASELPALIDLLEVPACGGLRSDVVNAIAQIAQRASGSADGVGVVLSALKVSDSVKTRSALLSVLGKLGDRRGYGEVIKACRDDSATVKDAARHALVAWPDAAA